MLDLNQTDLNVRLQRLNCCIGTKGSELLAKIKIGSPDVNCKLEELQVLQRMFKYIKCYHVIDSEVLATGTIEITNADNKAKIDLLINGVSLTGGPQDVPTNNEAVLMATIATYLNTTQSIYTFTYNGLIGVNGIIEVTGTCKNDVISYTATGGNTLVVIGLSEGECANNCLTEEQVQTMIDYMAQKCNLCFCDPGFEYES